MKKFILSLVMLLGSIIGVQAQTFSFICDNNVEENTLNGQLPFDLNQEPLFSDTQSSTLVTGGFSQGHQHFGPANAGEDYYDINHYAQTIRVSGRLPVAVTIDVINDNGIFYEVNRNDDYSQLPALLRTSDFDEAIAFVNALIISLSDDDGNGFIGEEEDMLDDATFNVPNPTNPGIYSITYTISYGDVTNVRISIIDGQFVAQGDDIDSITRDTLAEVLAALEAIDWANL